jgi:hypothetical protein
MEGSMVLGDNAYDVVTGFLATPIGPFNEFKAGGAGISDARSDEDLLIRFAQAHSG